MSKIAWQDPPNPNPSSARERSREIDSIVSQLQEYPGRWALVAASSRNGNGGPYDRRGCEVRYVEVSRAPRRFDIFARWPEVLA